MRHDDTAVTPNRAESGAQNVPIGARRLVDAFQSVLDRVARTEVRESVDLDLVPDLTAWGHLHSHGCSVLVKGGIWWVMPPHYEEAVGTPAAPQSYGRLCHSGGRPWHGGGYSIGPRSTRSSR